MRDARELSFEYYSQDIDKRRGAVYETLFERRSDMISELKKAATYEKDERLAVLMAQTCLIIENFPRAIDKEKRIASLLTQEKGVLNIIQEQWEYLEHNAPSNMVISVLGAMDTIPINSMNFIDVCLNSPDPNIRTMACGVAIKSGRPGHFAGVLRLITDRDAIVAKTAFETIRSIPESELGLHLECALMSSDEWLLTNVAPFLPYLVNEHLRKLVMRMQMHSHPVVAEYAKLAVYKLNEDLNKKYSGEKKEEYISPEEKEQIEQERKRIEEEEAFERDISNVTPDEMSIFVKELEGYGSGWNSIDTVNNDTKIKKQDLTGLDLINFEVPENISESFVEQSDALCDIQTDGIDDDILLSDNDFKDNTDVNSGVENINEESFLNQDLLLQESNYLSPEILSSSEEINLLDNPELLQEPSALSSELLPTSQETAMLENPELLQESSDLSSELLSSSEKTNLLNNEVAIQKSSELNPLPEKAEQTATIFENKEKNHVSLTGVASSLNNNSIQTFEAADTNYTNAIPEHQNSKIEQVVYKPAVPDEAKELTKVLPSFIGVPFYNIFTAQNKKEKLEALSETLTSLTAFLNLCFIQSCSFYAPQSDTLTRNIKQCLKNKLVGPTALRYLHNFVMAMKPARGNPIFFTYTLAGIMSESSEYNPLMLMRELQDYLRNPDDSNEDTIVQAVDGMITILKSLECMRNNTIVMRAPMGAKKPYANLNGSKAVPLEDSKMPILELPYGEVVLLSKDGSEALGLHPFIKYKNMQTVRITPRDAEMKILYDRLGLEE